MNIPVATVCFNCGRELAAGALPVRYGVCPGEEIFTLHAERFIREHNAAVDGRGEASAVPDQVHELAEVAR